MHPEETGQSVDLAPFTLLGQQLLQQRPVGNWSPVCVSYDGSQFTNACITHAGATVWMDPSHKDTVVEVFS